MHYGAEVVDALLPGKASKHQVPFYSCIFDNAITDCYSWSISKDGYFIFGGAYPMKDGQTRFTTLKEKMSAFQFQFGKAVKSENARCCFPHAGRILSAVRTTPF